MADATASCSNLPLRDQALDNGLPHTCCKSLIQPYLLAGCLLQNCPMSSVKHGRAAWTPAKVPLAQVSVFIKAPLKFAQSKRWMPSLYGT
jgi:hypothetical protein